MNRDARAVVEDLAELIDAIDRRSPQLQRSGESEIVEAAMRLRVQAQARISELTPVRRESVNSGRPVGD